MAEYFSKVISGTTRPVATTLSAQKLSGATTASLVAATGWDTGTKVHGIMYRTDAGTGAKIPGSQIDWKANISGTTLSNFEVTAGTDDTYAIGTTVELSPTAAWGDDMATGILVSHEQDGTLKDSIVTSAKIATSAVTTTKIADGAITSAKIGTEQVANSNLSNAAITNNKIADTTIASSKMNLGHAKDANGWYKLDFGTFQEYVYKTAAVLVPNNWGAYGQPYYSQTIKTGLGLPIGISSISQLSFHISGYMCLSGQGTNPIVYQLSGENGTLDDTATLLSIVTINPSALTIGAAYVQAIVTARKV